MKKSTKKIAAGVLFGVFISILLLIAGGIYFVYNFLHALSPPEVTVTQTYISTSADFINGLCIETLRVDSIGLEKYPVKYTVIRQTDCHIDHPQNKPPNPPDKIYFKKEGKYWWTEEEVNIPFIHEGLSRRTTGSTDRRPGIANGPRSKTCPIEFEKEQWYFITIGHPQVTGIFFYIDKNGNEKQHYLPSGVSPI